MQVVSAHMEVERKKKERNQQFNCGTNISYAIHAMED